MARFHGKVGFVIVSDNQETGIVSEEVVEKTFFGRVEEHARRWQSSDMTTDDLQLGNQIAIVANDFAYTYASAICYCEFMGNKWKVAGIRVKRPEIILTLGGVYNGPVAAQASGSSASAGSESVVQETSGQ